MSYTPTNWKTGDVVTPAKLNNMEQGIANAGGDGALVVHINSEWVDDELVWTADKTVAEIFAANQADIPVFGRVTGDGVYCGIMPLHYCDYDGDAGTGDAVFWALNDIFPSFSEGVGITVYDINLSGGEQRVLVDVTMYPPGL